MKRAILNFDTQKLLMATASVPIKNKIETDEPSHIKFYTHGNDEWRTSQSAGRQVVAVPIKNKR